MPQPSTAIGASRCERAAMRRRVDASGETGDDEHACRSKRSAEVGGDGRAIRGARTGADDRDRGSCQQLEVAASAHEEARRRVVDRVQEHRKAAVGAREKPEAARFEVATIGRLVERPPEPFEAPRARLVEQVLAARRRERGDRELAHCVSSAGGR